jgi:uncharacterized membrane protein
MSLIKSNYFLTFLASILSTNGLIMNSTTGIICSMLLSPYISKIIEIAMGIYSGKIVSEPYVELLIYVGITLATSIFYYLIQFNVLNVKKTELEPVNSEMTSRADLTFKDYISIFVYAMISGLTLGFVNNNKYFTDQQKLISNIGIGIGVGLLPNVANSGIQIIEHKRLFSFHSFMNLMTNVVGIVVGIILFMTMFKDTFA